MPWKKKKEKERRGKIESHVANFLVKIEAYSKTIFFLNKLKDFSSQKLYELPFKFCEKVKNKRLPNEFGAYMSKWCDSQTFFFFSVFLLGF
jgi:hypothetical protein